MAAKINTTWHIAHPMPPKPTLDQRIAWHLAHVQHCACRDIPRKLYAEILSRRISVPERLRPSTTSKVLDFAKLESKSPKVKYAFAKELLLVSIQSPEILYPYLGLWHRLLEGENQILKWTAIDIIGRLAVVDQEGRVDEEIPALIQFLHDGHLITTSHAIFALGEIARQKQALRPLLLGELLAVGDDEFESTECLEIAIGKVMEVLGQFSSEIHNSPTALTLIQRACHSSRPATAKKGIKLRNQLAIGA